MKLYYSPGACSMADHIALLEAGFAFEREKVDLKTKRTESGTDFAKINSKGYVPALTIDSKEIITENIAILDWIASQRAALAPPDLGGRTRLIEVLAYISTEIHKSLKTFFAGGSDAEKAQAGTTILKRLSYLADTFDGDFIFGPDISVADCYLFVMLLWAKKQGVEAPPRLAGFRDQMLKRPAVKKAMENEGLI